MTSQRDVLPALLLLDNPGASVAVAGPYPENSGILTGRYVIRISHEKETLSAVLTRDQIQELWSFVRSQG